MQPNKNNKTRILLGLEAADGGALKHVIYLANYLNKNLFDVTVILSPRSDNTYDILKSMTDIGVRLVFIPMIRNVNPLKDFISFVRIFSFLNKNTFDIVHAHSSKAGALFRVAAWFKKVPLTIYTPHCFYFQTKKGLGRTYYILIEKMLGKITDYIVVSELEKNYGLKYGIADGNKMLNINNAVKFNEYQHHDSCFVKKKFGLDENCIVVGSVGRLVEQKDWATYLYAAKRLLSSFPKVIFLIVGDGELYDGLKELTASLEIADNVRIMGYSANISEIYSIIDIYVSTSLWEGLPYVFLEAMWYKKPIIATQSGDVGNVIKDGLNGYLIPQKDHIHLSDKIQELILNKAMCVQFGEEGYKIVSRNFSFEEFIDKHEKLYLSHHQSSEI
ncbi:glycosyltransferase family 4 protein [Pedobacter kyonggii]|uniref:Glycosyltransferase family 1 protein n=1 Tax=Pedobacter kyonggii TaxID=1926871 RepID=A0A4V2JH80_9SPHI|nr:glycosyltransferase family 4 protein [Pedobacter kyonggii]TBO44281.1 glycosyltransferase family 1 protein [Pedobacter kyonggii]